LRFHLRFQLFVDDINCNLRFYFHIKFGLHLRSCYLKFKNLKKIYISPFLWAIQSSELCNTNKYQIFSCVFLWQRARQRGNFEGSFDKEATLRQRLQWISFKNPPHSLQNQIKIYKILTQFRYLFLIPNPNPTQTQIQTETKPNTAIPSFCNFRYTIDVQSIWDNLFKR